MNDDPTTVEELSARLRSPREVVRASDFDPADALNPTTVFATGTDGRCETWVVESGVEVLHRAFATEAEAVHAIAQEVLVGDPGAPRHLEGPDPTTVLELKAAYASLGRDPDNVTRGEVLRDSPQVEGLRVIEADGDGFRAYTLERGRRHDEEHFPDEAAAVAPLVASLRQEDGRRASDRDVARMQARVEVFRRLNEGVR